jgi:hypothetical protein
MRITSQVNESTHPRNDTAQPLIDGHQLTNTIETIFSHENYGNRKVITVYMSKLAEA